MDKQFGKNTINNPAMTRKPKQVILFTGLFFITILAWWYFIKPNPGLGGIATDNKCRRPQVIAAELEYTVCAQKLSELSASDIAAFEGNADMKFPPNAHGIYAYTTGFREMYTEVHFSIKPSELPAFLKTTLCNKPLQPATTFTNIPDHMNKQLEYCIGESKTARQSIYVDVSSSTSYIVYINDSTQNLPTPTP